jgi:transcriptional regulator with XRE-family HTH domain
MPAGPQIRAARALLGITADELARLASVTLRTIQRFERRDGIPASRGGTLGRIRATLEAEGIEFIGDPITSPGVRLNRKPG